MYVMVCDERNNKKIYIGQFHVDVNLSVTLYFASKPISIGIILKPELCSFQI